MCLCVRETKVKKKKNFEEVPFKQILKEMMCYSCDQT